MNPILKNSDTSKKTKRFQRYFNKAVQYQSQNNIELAIELYDKALYHNNNHLPTIQALGILLQQSEQYDKALSYFHRATTLHRHSATLNNALGNCYENCQHWEQAKQHYNKAITLKQDYAEALNNLGNLCRKMGDYQQAERHLLKSLRLCINVSTLINLGLHMAEMHNYSQAHSFFDHALRLQPFNNKIKWYKALSLLTEGEFKQGWELYTSNNLSSINFQPSQAPNHKNTEKSEYYFTNKHIHIKGKQHIEDEIMFGSCIQEIITQSKSCIIECDQRLVPLFQRSFHNAEVIPKSTNNMTHQLDVEENISISMVNIARFFRQSFNDFPVQYGYLRASSKATQFWQKKYRKHSNNLNIGIAWLNPASEDSNNCCPLTHWSIIFEHAECQLINLQHGQIQKELEQFSMPVLNWPDCDHQNNIEQLAAQISALDLVITTNNTVAHLAGALGKTVWIILPYAANWRWFNGKNPCPWYSSARLFKQTQPGEWKNLLHQMNVELLKQFDENKQSLAAS